MFPRFLIVLVAEFDRPTGAENSRHLALLYPLKNTDFGSNGRVLVDILPLSKHIVPPKVWLNRPSFGTLFATDFAHSRHVFGIL